MSEPPGVRCDPTTLVTLRDMELREMNAYKAQDYEQLKSLSRDLTIVRSVITTCWFNQFLDRCLNTRFKELAAASCLEG